MQALTRNLLAGLAVLSGGAALALQGGPAGGTLIAGLLAALFACGAVVAHDPRGGVLATSALAFGANAYLFSRKLDAASGPSACNVGEVLNCDVINTSAASEAFGLPITLFGMGLYLGLGLATLLPRTSTPRLFQVTGLFAALSLAYSVYLAWVSAQIGAFCVVCATIYVSNALLLWAAVRGSRAEGRALFDEAGGVFGSTSLLTVVGTFLVVVVLGAGSWNRTGAVAGSTSASATAHVSDLARLFTTPAGPVELDGTEPVLGDPGAPYTIVEWADFGCPHCARASEELERIVKEYPVKVHFKHFPLSGECNPALQPGGGAERCRAAQATECAQQQGRFFEMSRLVFKNQGYFADSDLAYMAEQAGLDMDAWRACMADDSALAGIRADAEAGARAGVRGTPALFLHGTHGADYVELTWGPTSAVRLLEALEAGATLPPPGPRP